MKTYLNENNTFYKKTLQYIKNTFSNNIQFYYESLPLSGVTYSFTQTDSVFIWTRGGYNIARYRGFYPIFIKVKTKDKGMFKKHCKKLSLRINKKTGIFYKVTFLNSFEIGFCSEIPVDNLQNTISFMKKNKYNFEPALEMIKELYKKDIKVKYKEAITNV